ncbi:transposase zinc-binding domain-containing protein [Candidatus Enterovibrio escicola]|uniref:transposase zinc-binding domain-containing protein n=1 Tax=Candidatus Enterovibrio escicola TaxID=1927127 RepID=UPI000BE2E09F
MNFKGIKSKLLRFKRIFTTNWVIFVSSHPRDDTDYYHSGIANMLKCGSSKNGFATYPCLGCGQGQHKVDFSCKGKYCP